VCRIQFPYQPPPQVVTPPPPQESWPPPQPAWGQSAPQQDPTAAWGQPAAQQESTGWGQPAPQSPQVPQYSGYGQQPQPTSMAEPPVIRSTREATGGSGLMVWGVLLIIGSVGFVTVWMMIRGGGRHQATGGGSGITEVSLYNFRYKQPQAPWQSDSTDVRAKLKVTVVAMERTTKDGDPDAWFAISATDYKDRQPRDRELDLGLRDRLKYFENLESEVIPNAKWAGEPAFGFGFEGEVGGVLMTGEAYAMRYKGIGYWFFAWAPKESFPSRQAEFVDLRERVTFMGDRTAWVEKKINLKEFKPKMGSYSVSDTDGLWKEQVLGEEEPKTDPEMKELRPTISLYAEPENRDKDTRRLRINQGRLHVYVIPTDGEPLEAAKKFVQAQLDKDVEDVEGAKVTLSDFTGPIPEGFVKPSIPYLRMKSESTIDKDKKQLHVITAQNIGGKTVVVWAECMDRARDYWDGYLLKIAGSLKGSGAELKTGD